MSKPALRERALAARAVAHEEGHDAAAQARLAEFLAPWRGRPLAGYLPMRSEIDPRPVMRDWDGPVGVPVVEARAAPLGFALWRHGVDLRAGTFGIDVPAEAEAMVPEVVIVPLVGFDAAGNRLGYGGGFYDRTLARLRESVDVLAVGFAYAAQELPQIPAEPTDIPLSAIVTDAGVRRFG